MPTETMEIKTADGPMPGYVSRPDGAPKGSVVVIQEAFGITRHIEEITERLAGAGWTAVAPALFHRLGSPVFAYDDFPSVMPAMKSLTREGITADVGAAFDLLASEGFSPSNQCIVGFCMGGSVAFYTATERAIGAAVTFYGGGVADGRFGFPSQVDSAPALKTPWLGLYGDLDKGIPPEQVEQLGQAAATSGSPTEVVRYPDAGHGFNCNDRAEAYNASAAADAWSRTLAWFDSHAAR